MDKPIDSCASCIWWKMANSTAGLCTRYPPQMVAVGAELKQTLPTTQADYLCGEHERVLVSTPVLH